MTAIDIKSDIHKKIDIIQDITILNEIYVLLEKQNIKESDFWDDLSPDQKSDIPTGRALLRHWYL